MTVFVLDASTTLAWLFADEISTYADSVFQAFADDSAVVPEIWAPEVANALLVAERKGRITPSETAGNLSDLEALSITILSRGLESSLRRALPLARTYDLSAYDASYLQLALDEEAPLATSDGRLSKAAVAAGVELFQPTTPA